MNEPAQPSRPLTSIEKRRITAGGTWCENCGVVHRMSKARWAVAGTCCECRAYTTDVHLGSIFAKVDGKQSAALVLACVYCWRRGFTIKLHEEFGVPEGTPIELTEARA